MLTSVWAVLKKVNITLKKTTAYKEQDSEKMRRYLDGLTCFPNTPIVYIDDTGIDTYLYRHKARAARGQKGDDKVSGRRFERISVVAGQIGSQIVAPLLYHGTMTGELFTKWYQEHLLPSLTEPHLIIMDNATFHPKKQLDELALVKRHYFLPLPLIPLNLIQLNDSWLA